MKRILTSTEKRTDNIITNTKRKNISPDNTMIDTLSPKKRSWNMARIKSSDTKPEILVRSLLSRMGHRFHKNRKDLPGNPDIVLPKYKIAIFVHGCFWHKHKGCKSSNIPKTNVEFWKNKLNANVKRDKTAKRSLNRKGWKYITIWECKLDNMNKLKTRLRKLLKRKKLK